MIPIQDDPGEPRRSWPWVMLSVLLLNVAAFVFELGFAGSASLDKLFLSAGVVPIEFTHGVIVAAPPLGTPITTLFTSMFLHGGLLHIASNMLYLFIFGDNVEDKLGHLRFLIFYLVCGVVAGITHIVVNANSPVPSIGASGAIAGVLAAYLRLFPHARVRTLLFIGPLILIPRIAAAILILFWFATQFLSGIMSLGATTQETSGVAVWAHIGGFICGLILLEMLRPRTRAAVGAY